MKNVTWIGVLVVVLALAVIPFWASRTKPIPRSTKVAECTNTTLRFSFAAPPGDSYNFALGVGGAKNLADVKQPEYRGKFQITDGQKDVFELDFDSQQSRSASWLRREDKVAGYTFTLPRREGQQSLDSVLRAKVTYEAIVTFSSPPPAKSSLWLQWRQRRVEAAQ